MREINTIFWDLDGTLINTNDLYDEAIKYACKKINCTMLHEIEEVPNGQTLLADFSFLTGLGVDDNLELLNQLKKHAISYFKDNFSNTLAINSSIELFNYFHQLGLKQSIISNANQELCDFTTAKIGIRDKCLYCFGIETVKYGKPNPELYQLALKAHLATESQCLAFEDSSNGINAAKSANLTVISVGTEAGDANPNYIWDINLEPALILFSKLSQSYKFTNHIG